MSVDYSQLGPPSLGRYLNISGSSFTQLCHFANTEIKSSCEIFARWWFGGFRLATWCSKTNENALCVFSVYVCVCERDIRSWFSPPSCPWWVCFPSADSWRKTDSVWTSETWKLRQADIKRCHQSWCTPLPLRYHLLFTFSSAPSVSIWCLDVYLAPLYVPKPRPDGSFSCHIGSFIRAILECLWIDIGITPLPLSSPFPPSWEGEAAVQGSHADGGEREKTENKKMMGNLRRAVANN